MKTGDSLLHFALCTQHFALPLYRTPRIRRNLTIRSLDFADVSNTMDITTVSGASAFQQQKLANNVQTSVDAKVLNIAKTEGTGALQLLQSASAPTAGTTTSTGGIDTFA
jgi:Holliday junction resolvasome RuvABC ATP-dependent DNA helicase subunit